MGTNCAPTWANLSLRTYEILRAKPNDLGIRLFGRFIDDCIIVHTGREDHLLTWMTSIYPAHLPILPQQTAQAAGVVFFDLHILGLCPLAHAVYWKPTHSSNYIPWDSNTPRHIKAGWVKGEYIRYLRLSSHEPFFQAASLRLIHALQRLKYPKQVYMPLPVQWSDRENRLNLKAKDPTKTHVLRVPYHASINLSFQPILHRMRLELPFLPPLHIRAVPLCPPNLRKFWHTALCRTFGLPPVDGVVFPEGREQSPSDPSLLLLLTSHN